MYANQQYSLWKAAYLLTEGVSTVSHTAPDIQRMAPKSYALGGLKIIFKKRAPKMQQWGSVTGLAFYS